MRVRRSRGSTPFPNLPQNCLKCPAPNLKTQMLGSQLKFSAILPNAPTGELYTLRHHSAVCVGTLCIPVYSHFSGFAPKRKDWGAFIRWRQKWRMCVRLSQSFSVFHCVSQWRFYVGARGHRPPNLAQPPKFLDTVVLLLVELIGSIVITLKFRLAVVASQMMRGQAPKYFS